MEVLVKWASQEFLTVPQLTRVIVKRALSEYLKQHPLEAVEPDSPTPKPAAAKAKPAATAKAKAKRKPTSKGAS
jgi:hypothetical protein